MALQQELHYQFTYFALPFIVFGKVDDTYNKLKSYNRTAYLLTLWNGLANKLKESLYGRTIDCQKLEIEKNKEIYLITLPKPKSQAEAYYIGIYYELNRSIFKTTVQRVRYFTLEKSWDYEINKESYVVGEMEKGSDIINFKHINHGFVEKNDIKIFPKAIKNILNNNKKGEFWRKSKIPLKNQIASEKIDSPLSKPEKQEDELEELWNKWENDKVIIHFKDQMNEVIEPLFLFIMELRNILVEKRVFSESQIKSIDETIMGAMFTISKGSFIVGLEYPEFSDSPTSFRGSKADKLLEQFSELTIQIFTLLISKSLENKLFDNKHIYSLSRIMGDSLYETRLKCYILGAEISPNNFGNYWKYKTFSDLS